MLVGCELVINLGIKRIAAAQNILSFTDIKKNLLF